MNSYFLCIKSYISYGQTQSCPSFNLYQQLRSTFDVCTLGSVPPCLQPLDSLLILLWFDLLPLISVVVWLNERAWDVHRTKSNPILLRFCVSDFFSPGLAVLVIIWVLGPLQKACLILCSSLWSDFNFGRQMFIEHYLETGGHRSQFIRTNKQKPNLH